MCSHAGLDLPEKHDAQYAETLSMIEAMRKKYPYSSQDIVAYTHIARISEDESAVQKLLGRVEHFTRQINEQNLSVAWLESSITQRIEECSTQQLQPILQGLRGHLPVEIREMVYKYLMDCEPVVVPTTESSTRYSPDADELDPCLADYKFNRLIMGHDAADEIRVYFLRTTPIYFRGFHSSTGLATLLDMESWFYRPLRDYIRHLRVYVHCETFLSNMQDLKQAMPDVWNSELMKLGEMKLYNSYESCLAPLHDLPFYKHKIKLEICVFYGEHEDYLNPSEVTGGRRHKHNILESVKPTYFYARNAGADVSVRCEYFDTGSGTDVSWELDLDAEKWAQSPEPAYLMIFEDIPSCRELWSERRHLSDSLAKRDTTPNISWKHGLFEPPFSACACTTCVEALDVLEVNCGNPWIEQIDYGDEMLEYWESISGVVEDTDNAWSV